MAESLHVDGCASPMPPPRALSQDVPQAQRARVLHPARSL